MNLLLPWSLLWLAFLWNPYHPYVHHRFKGQPKWWPEASIPFVFISIVLHIYVHQLLSLLTAKTQFLSLSVFSLFGKTAQKKKLKEKTVLMLTNLELMCDSFWAVLGGRREKQPLSLNCLWHGPKTLEGFHSALLSNQQDDSAFSSIDTQRNIAYAVSLSTLSVCLLGFFSNKLFR